MNKLPEFIWLGNSESRFWLNLDKYTQWLLLGTPVKSDATQYNSWAINSA